LGGIVRQGSVRHSSAPPLRERNAWIALMLLMVLLLLTGGSARGDLVVLIVMRPLSVAFLAYGIWNLQGENFRNNRFSFVMLGLILLLTLAHLVPLPPGLWASLPGREQVVSFAQATGTFDVWRPVTMMQWTTWNAFYAEVTVAAVLVLASQLDREGRYRLLSFCLLLGAASATLGLLQVMADTDSMLYFYPVSSRGSAIGFLANRNHAAAFLASMYPLLAVFAAAGDPPRRSGARRLVAAGRGRLAVAISAGIVIIPMLLVVGSRAGLALGAIGIVLALPVYFMSKPRSERAISGRVILIGVLILAALAALSLYFARAEAIERLVTAGSRDELRFKVWPVIAGLTAKYFPLGSGIGSFVEVYQLDEPQRLLHRSYLNHAHNDWLEVVMTAGIPGALLLIAATVGWAMATLRVFRSSEGTRRDIILGRAGAVIILLMGLASIGDYPLRTPFLAAYFVICAVWLAAGARAAREGTKLTRDDVDRSATLQPQFG
jgi:O-antigen ligase